MAALLCAAAVLSSGCAMAAKQALAQEDTYALYFQVRDLEEAGGGDAIGTEPSSLKKRDGGSAAEVAASMVELLLAGPQDELLQSPFPADTALQSVTVDGSRAVVDLTTAYSALSGVALTVADYCVTLTLTQIPEIQTVAVTVGGRELAYRDKQDFSARDVLFASTEDVVGTVEVTLLFQNDRGGLRGEARTLDLYEGDTQAEAVVQALLNGPEGKELTSPFPEGFSVQSVWTEEDICYVSLSSTMIEELPEDAALRLPILSLANSLLTLESVEAVRFLVNGETVETVGGMDVSRLFEN